MSDQQTTFSIDGSVATICLNRPDRGNAITLEMAEQLREAANRCDKEPSIRAVILTGKGKMFCAGGDLKNFIAQGDRADRYVLETTQALHAAISRFNWMDAPVIAAINGTCGGGGFSLALTTDIAIAAESAKFTMAYTRAGLSPDGSASFFLAKMIGLRRAKEMALLNPVIDAQQALDWGLINQVVADEEIMVTANKIAHKLAKGATRAIGETKRLMLSGANESLESQMEKESRTISMTMGSTNGQEGMLAFIEKRRPQFEPDPQ